MAAVKGTPSAADGAKVKEALVSKRKTAPKKPAPWKPTTYPVVRGGAVGSLKLEEGGEFTPKNPRQEAELLKRGMIKKD